MQNKMFLVSLKIKETQARNSKNNEQQIKVN